MADYCHSCEEAGIETEAGHFVGPKTSRPLLTDKKGRPLCDFHWWLMFEGPDSKGGMTWGEYTRRWTKPSLPVVTSPPLNVQASALKRPKKNRP